MVPAWGPRASGHTGRAPEKIGPAWRGAWHELRDVFRSHLETGSVPKGVISGDGPLAQSYDRGQGGKPVPCRYDIIVAAPDISVASASTFTSSQRLSAATMPWSWRS